VFCIETMVFAVKVSVVSHEKGALEVDDILGNRTRQRVGFRPDGRIV